jgi:methionyl-tRNA formyltransferase
VLETTNRLLVASADAALEILDVQPAGRRSMNASDFLRGYRPCPGDCFGPG